jgi:chloramphenicol O-acetyltransferase
MKQKRNKSNRLPVLFSSLPLEEKEKVKYSMEQYNEINYEKYTSIEDFYQNFYRKVKRGRQNFLKKASSPKKLNDFF